MNGYLQNIRGKFLACLPESNLDVFAMLLHVLEEFTGCGVLVCIKAYRYIALHLID